MLIGHHSAHRNHEVRRQTVNARKMYGDANKEQLSCNTYCTCIRALKSPRMRAAENSKKILAPLKLKNCAAFHIGGFSKMIKTKEEHISRL